MIDPDSTKFGKITVLEDEACVTVNGKNRLGGYTGDSQVLAHVLEGQWHVILDNKSGVSHNTCVKVLGNM